MVVADFNGDGRPDLALGRLGKSLPIPSIELIFNLGALQFTRATVGRIPAFREDVMSLCALDVDRDGDPDLVAGTSGSGVRVLINQGGAFTDETSLRMFGGTWYANRIVACDVNRDGWQDFLIAPGVNGIAKERVMVAVNTGTGRFVPEAALSGHAGYAWDIACGDTDGDGWPEIVVIREDYVQQMYSCSAQGFVDVSHRLPQSLMVPLATGVLVDVDHDGFLDLVVAEFSGGRGPRVVVNDRRGTLREAGILGGPPDGSGNEILVADFDGDGDADICDGRATSWFPLDYWMALFVGLPRQAYVPRSILRGGTWTLWFTTAPGHVVAPWLSAAVGPRQTLGALGDWFLDPASSVSLGLLPVNAQNFATLALPVPPAGLPLGLRIYTQALDLDPAVPSRSHVMGVGSGTVQ